MRTFGFAGVMAVAVVAMPLSAQMEANPRVMKIFAGGRYLSPLCSLKGDFRTSSAGTYLKTSVEGSEGGGRPDNDKRVGIIKKAKDQALAAIEANPKGGAGWYYLGRSELLLGNLTGADTAFTKAAELAPDCAEEIKGYRQQAWQPLVTAASATKDPAEGEQLLREANTISRDYPQGFFGMGIIFANTEKYDSAAAYFAIAAEKSQNNPQLAEQRQSALRNLGIMLQAAEKHTEAVTAFRSFLASSPDDAQVRRAMATSLRLSGQAEEAEKIESAMLASSIADGTATMSDLLNRGITLFNEQKYDEAAKFFGMVLEKEPFNHDALFNLANVHFAKKDGAKLVEAAERLIAMEPLNSTNVKLLGEGYRTIGNQDKLLSTIGQVMAMPTELTIEFFQPQAAGAKLVGSAKGLAAKTIEDKPLPAAAKTVTFEFLAKDGSVVASKEVAIPALTAGQPHAIDIEVQGAGIIAWRYTAK
jgi:tetratricopeptide (TPR) repeat protein